MNDEFYQQFPSFNENSKENRINKKLKTDYNEFLKSTKDKKPEVNHRRTKIPVARTNSKELDVFSVEERNRRVVNESREKMANYQKDLLHQIEEIKIHKKHEKDQEKENQRKLEERLQRQIESMNIESDDRIVERVHSSKDNYPLENRRNNDVYRFFSNSSASLFNYKDQYFQDIEILKDFNNEKVAKCIQCHKKLDVLCYKCKSHTAPNEMSYSNPINYRTTSQSDILKDPKSYIPYTFDNFRRYQKNSLNNVASNDYPKLYSDFKRRKKPVSKESNSNKALHVDYKDQELSELLKSDHQQYTVITGYAKSLLGKT